MLVIRAEASQTTSFPRRCGTARPHFLPSVGSSVYSAGGARPDRPRAGGAAVTSSPAPPRWDRRGPRRAARCHIRTTARDPWYDVGGGRRDGSHAGHRRRRGTVVDRPGPPRGPHERVLRQPAVRDADGG